MATSINSEDGECYGCFRICQGTILPKCSGDIGAGFGMQHDLCGKCLSEHAHKTVIERDGLRADGIACSIENCMGTFPLHFLEPHVEKEVFEDIRAHVQSCSFEDAKRDGLPVEQCKKCTFFDFVDQNHEADKHFLCPQCNYDHCRQCGEEWDAEHKEHNSCVEPARAARRVEEQRKQEEAAIKKRALDAEKAKKKNILDQEDRWRTRTQPSRSAKESSTTKTAQRQSKNGANSSFDSQHHSSNDECLRLMIEEQNKKIQALENTVMNMQKNMDCLQEQLAKNSHKACSGCHRSTKMVQCEAGEKKKDDDATTDTHEICCSCLKLKVMQGNIKVIVDGTGIRCPIRNCLNVITTESLKYTMGNAVLVNIMLKT